jgi:hypothetical protein
MRCEQPANAGQEKTWKAVEKKRPMMQEMRDAKKDSEGIKWGLNEPFFAMA